ncbi:integrator complex subunit 12 [Drosophila eugracilis]|uniref:integrator complex subunit 12 n=1 Tax=Drosophila eugracilis TaxID=29029 RepID=UPI0007E63314|nr:integrator complex subunit 12 [Drosophila eugracilis]
MAANIAAAAAAAQEVDPVLKKAIKLLHSTNPSSSIELRILLEEALKSRYGPEKSLTNNMTPRMLEDEANFPGRAATPPQQPINPDEIINLTNSPDKEPSDSVDTIADSDDGLSAVGIVNTGDTGDFGDLNCCVCGEMVFTATNRLIECSKCGAMYHQECHKPPITKEEAADDQEQTWQCDTCCNKPTTSGKTTAAPAVTPTVFIADEPMPLTSKAKSSAASSRSSNSSNSSSPFYRPEPSSSTNASSSSSSKHGHKSSSSSSSKSHKEERSSKSTATPSLSAIGGLEKHSSSGSGTSSSRRSSSSTKSSSKSSSSKHHESGSSKRRSKQ